MEERQLNFKGRDNTTLIIDSDGKLLKLVTDIYNKIKLNLGFCYEQLGNGTLTEGMKEVHLSLTESYVLDFLKAFGYDGILKKEKEERFAEIRELNTQNRELRKQLGEKLSNEDAREKIKNMAESFKSWWNINGFGHTSEIYFNDYGYLKVKLSGMISDAYRDKDNTKTEEDKVQYLKELGFEINEDKGVLANDKNIELLNVLIKNKYPSATIVNAEFYFGRGKSQIKNIDVFITNLDEII
jgi:hypothetical protein